MDFGYFHEEESEQFAFYRIPQVLFKDEKFAKLSTDAKVLYGLFLNRVSLSKKNHWIDDEGRVYVYYTRICIMSGRSALCLISGSCALPLGLPLRLRLQALSEL